RDKVRDLSRDLDLTLDRDLDLDRALVRTRALAQPRDMAWALERWMQVLSRGKLPRSIEREAFRLASAAIQAELLGASRSADRPPFRRSSTVEMLEAFRKPEIVAQELQETDAYEQAIQEWKDVLASPLSPVPILEDALSRDWEELPADPEG